MLIRRMPVVAVQMYMMVVDTARPAKGIATILMNVTLALHAGFHNTVVGNQIQNPRTVVFNHNLAALMKIVMAQTSVIQHGAWRVRRNAAGKLRLKV